jgi:hypothetical protein
VIDLFSDDELLPIERDAARLRKKQKKTAEEAGQEMQLNIEDRERFQLPSGQGVLKRKVFWCVSFVCLR